MCKVYQSQYYLGSTGGSGPCTHGVHVKAETAALKGMYRNARLVHIPLKGVLSRAVKEVASWLAYLFMLFPSSSVSLALKIKSKRSSFLSELIWSGHWENFPKAACLCLYGDTKFALLCLKPTDALGERVLFVYFELWKANIYSCPGLKAFSTQNYK